MDLQVEYQPCIERIKALFREFKTHIPKQFKLKGDEHELTLCIGIECDFFEDEERWELLDELRDLSFEFDFSVAADVYGRGIKNLSWT